MLFQKNIIKKYIALLDEQLLLTAWQQYQSYFLNAEIQQNILHSKEEQFQEGFLRELFVNVLGYKLNPSPGYNLITEKKNVTNAKKADGAIFLNGNVIGVIELKDHKTTDLSKVENQAFGYKSQHVGTRLVVISNFEKLRLYIDNAVEHREWNLFTLKEADFRELYLCLAWSQVEKGAPLLTLNQQLQQKRSRFLRRLRENFEGVKVTTALQTFDQLDFASFTKELKKQKIKLSLSQQDEWEDYFNDYAAACQQLSEQIAQTNNEIDTQVFALYGLTAEEREIIMEA